MRVLDRYLLREIALPFAAGMGLFFAVVAFTEVLKVSDAVTGLGMNGAEMASALLYSLPPLMGFLLPVACLFATLLAIGRLAGDQELLGLGSLGQSPLALLRMPAAFATGMACLSMAALIWGEPWGIRGLRALMARSAQRAVASGVRVGTFNEWVPGFTLYAAGRDAEARLTGVFLADRRDPERPLMISAARGEVSGGQASGDLVLTLWQGTVWLEDPAARVHRLVHFDSSEYHLDVQRLVGKKARYLNRVQELSVSELYAEAQAPQTSAPHRALLLITLQRKLAVPLAALIFALLAVPLAHRVRGGARAAGFLLSLALVAGYYYLGRALELSARAERLSPYVAAWLPNGLGLLALLVLLGRLRGRRP